MKIYILEASWDWEGSDYMGTFSTKELAEQYIQKYGVSHSLLYEENLSRRQADFWFYASSGSCNLTITESELDELLK